MAPPATANMIMIAAIESSKAFLFMHISPDLR
jgi:hypothetical protein